MNIKKIINELNKNLIVGLLSIIPIATVISLFSFLYDYVKNIFIYFVGKIDNMWIPVFLIIITTVFFILIGYQVRKMKKIFILSSLEEYLSKIPFVGFIIKTMKEVIKILYKEDNSDYLGVVKVPFLNAKTIGLITKIEGDIYTVFVPTAPNPTSGYVLFYNKKDVEILNMSVQDVFKLQLSLGIEH